MRFALALIAALPLSALAAPYELADLKALDKDQAWQELVPHLNDIAPSRRDAEWKAIAERACAGVLDAAELKDERSAQSMLFEIERLLKQFPWLKTSKVFMARRAEVGFKAMGWTFSSSRHASGDDQWLDGLEEFVALDTVTPDIALRGAKVVTGRLIPIVAFPLLKTALARGGKEVCKDKDLQQALLGAVEEGSWPKENAEMQTTCWAEFKPVIVAEVSRPDATRTLRIKLCPNLIERKALSDEQKTKLCTFD
jgi:hypothetical protein